LMVSVAGSLITNSLSTSTLLTMTQANTFVPGNFVVLQGLVNGATANGVIVRILTATTTGWTATWSGTSFSTGAETAATAQLIVTNAGAPVGCLAGDASIITNSLATASSAGTQGVITFTTPQLFNPGNLTFISGLTHGAILNGSIYAVLASGLTNALYKAYGQNAGATTSADAGVASVMVTGAPLTTAETTGELPAGAYPAACLADIFTIRLIGQKLKM